MRVGICLHLGNYSLWSEMKKYLLNIKRVTSSLDLYLSYQVDNPILHEIIREFPGTLFVNSVYGMDIGGQLLNLNNLFRSGKTYELVLFLHTKSRSGWRSLLMASTCLFEGTVRSCIDIFNREELVGIIGSSYWRYNLQKANYNHEYLTEYASRWNLRYQKDDPNTYFIAGTIFWMRFSLLERFVREKGVDFAEEYNRLEKIKGRVLNTRPTRLHSWERIFGLITSHYGYSVYGLMPVAYENPSLPPDFDSRRYLEKNPDLRLIGGIPAELLAFHYYFYGRGEGRSYK